MVTVAIAGATSGIGPVFVKQMLATKKHTVIALSRSTNDELTSMGAIVRTVDYTSHSSLVSALSGVHTVISCLNALDKTSVVDAQLALLKAAEEAGVKRYAPSEYAVSSNDIADAFAPKKIIWDACKASGLECTRFTCGLFTNVCGTGTPKGEKEALGGLRPWTYTIDMVAGTADLVGGGRAEISFTETGDLGAFVAASLDLDHWKDEMGMEGDRISWEELIRVAEKVTNRKFLRKNMPIDEAEELAKTHASKRFYYQTRISMEKGEGTVEPYLNKVCPQVNPISVEAFIKKWWEGVELPEPAWRAPQIFGGEKG